MANISMPSLIKAVASSALSLFRPVPESQRKTARIVTATVVIASAGLKEKSHVSRQFHPASLRATLPRSKRVTASRARLALTVCGLLLSLLLAALDQTIVGTALPSIIANLGGFDHYAWVTTAYLVASTVAVPIAGKLSDQLGRKPLLIGSMLAFLVTSLLCAQAQTFNQLVAARAVQGLSGGAITAAVFATVPTLFSPASRAESGPVCARCGARVDPPPSWGGLDEAPDTTKFVGRHEELALLIIN